MPWTGYLMKSGRHTVKTDEKSIFVGVGDRNNDATDRNSALRLLVLSGEARRVGKMTYKEYVEKYNLCFGHEDYLDGARMADSLGDLLEYFQERKYSCPDVVFGGVPVRLTIDLDFAIDSIEEQLYDQDFAGEDYEMTDEGKLFLKKCFSEYNEKYANYGNYCDVVAVTVPDEMKY